MISLSSKQLSALIEADTLRLQARILLYVQESMPLAIEGMNDNELRREIDFADGRARECGIRSDLGRTHAAILTLVAGRAPWNDVDFLTYLTQANETPDDQIEHFLEIVLEDESE